MPQRILDTVILVRHWRESRRGRQRSSIAEAKRWARNLIELRQTNLIVTPVRLEFLAGTRTSEELRLSRAFLAAFTVADQGRIVDEDWQRALALVERIPPDGRPRDLGDCLIRAIADRLHVDVATSDTGMPRSGRPSQRAWRRQR